MHFARSGAVRQRCGMQPAWHRLSWNTAKNDHDIWMEKILSAVRSLRQQLESSKAGAGTPDTASRSAPGLGREGPR